MVSNAGNWQEKDWERYVNRLLSNHHAMFGGSYQRVPDHKGDRGLEGFTDTGEAYQAYADQSSKNNEERTRKQKKKIREDFAKLEKYSDFWQEMLGDTKLTAKEFEFLTTADRTSVSYGIVAKWLGECPLDFPGDSNV